MKTSLLIIICLASAIALAAQSPAVEKIEPPNWWVGHTINPVRLLVRGNNLKGAKVSSDRKLKASNVRVNSRGDYLFFDVRIPIDAQLGEYGFRVTTAFGETTIPFSIGRMPRPSIPVNNSDVIYLIMTDRFANGDGKKEDDLNRANPRMWHGGDIRGVTQKLDYLKSLGVTAIWLTPWYDNSDGINICDKPWCPMSSYHGYGAIDFYGVENHFGNLDDVKRLVAEANKKGLKIIQDQVANHVGSAHPWVKNPPLEDWFPPFSQNRFNNSALLSPHSPPAERENLVKGWFDFSLPDLDQTEPEVSKYLIQNAMWWIAETGISGIRQDTLQYMPRTFIRDWSSAIKKQYPEFYMVGEVLVRNSATTALFQGGKMGWDGIDTKLPSVFDFDLWQTSRDVFTGKKPARALREVLTYDGLYPNWNLLTVPQSNHDTDRFMSLEGATKRGAMLNLAFVVATRGIPQLYAGEEILMTGGNDPDNRKDFPGGWKGDVSDKFNRNALTGDEREMWDWTSRWISLRSQHKAIQTGKLEDIYYDDNVYAFIRESPSESLLFLFNSSKSDQNVKLSSNRWKNNGVCLSQIVVEGKQASVSERVCADKNNDFIEVTVPKMSASVYSLKR